MHVHAAELCCLTEEKSLNRVLVGHHLHNPLETMLLLTSVTTHTVCAGLKPFVIPAKHTWAMFFQMVRPLHLSTHNPTTLNQKGADIGSQYRSIILFSDAFQREIAGHIIAEIQQIYSRTLVTELKQLEAFYIVIVRP